MNLDNLVIWKLFFLLTIIICGCSDSTQPENIVHETIIPLAQDNFWLYNYQEYDSLGNKTYFEGSFRQVGIDTVISGTTWYSFMSVPPGYWYTNKADGFWELTIENNKKNELLLLLYPPRLGIYFTNEYHSREVVSLGEEVTVLDTQYVAIHYSTKYFNSEYLSNEIYAVPNIGTVKEVLYKKSANNEPYIFSKRELTNYYSLNK